jgi:Flp pilus assembly protein CpaB
MNATAHRFWNVAIALGLGLLAITLTTFYVTNYKHHVQRGESNVNVLVAAHDIPAGTSGADLISKHMLGTASVARRAVVPGAISNADQVRSMVVIQPVFAGEQITARRFGTQAQQGIRSQLEGTARAFQLPGDSNQLLAGTLRAGDHVDLVANLKYKFINFRTGSSSTSSDDLVASRVVLRNLLVLRAPDGARATSQLTPNDASYSAVLQVTDSQAQKLFFVMKNGDWSLQLRPVLNPQDSPPSVETVGSVLGDGLHQGQIDQLVFGTGRR